MSIPHTSGTRTTTILPITIALILVPLFSAYAGNISTIDELSPAYGPEVCKECHKETHKGWKNSWHGRSVIDSRVLRTWRTFILSGLDRSEGSRKNLREICLPCHAPRTDDASDDLVREIAAMVITAVEEIDTYETVDEQGPPGAGEQGAAPVKGEKPSPSTDKDDGKDSVITQKQEPAPDKAPPAAGGPFPDSPWIRKKLNDFRNMLFEAFQDLSSTPAEESRDISGEAAEVKVAAPEGPEKAMPAEDEDSADGPAEDFTVTFVEEGETPAEPGEDIDMEVEELSATLVVEEGRVKIEYKPYDPDLEPAFLDKGETLGEKSVRELSKLNIDCMVCHGMKALPGGNPRPRTIYGTSGAGSVEHREALGAETAVSAFLKTSEFCAQCHHGCPPGMPSSICPTIWTSYKEEYIARGGAKTCQDCHMNGADLRSHRFPGAYDEDLMKEGVLLSLEAEPTRYVYHLENRIVPAVVINVDVKNAAGHGIPHGCTYTPKAVLSVRVTDQDGNELFSENKTYEAYNLHLPDNREGYLGLNEWDITAMERLDMGIEPGATDSSTFVAALNEDTESVVVEASFTYIYEEGVSAVIQKETGNIEFSTGIEKKPLSR